MHTNQHLQNAWNKYGEDAFEFVVIEYVEAKTDLVSIEQLYIDAYWPSGKLYNLLPIAGSRLGSRHTEETKTKLRLAQKGKHRGPRAPLSEEWKAKIGEAQKGKHRSEETRAKMSKSASKPKGRPSWNSGQSKFTTPEEKKEAQRIQSRDSARRHRAKSKEDISPNSL